MSKQKKTGYRILLTLLLLSLSPNLHIGDFCEGMWKGLLFVLLSFLFIISFLIILFRDLFRTLKTKERFDFIPLILFITFILANWFLTVANANKYWRAIRYEGTVEHKNGRATIVLYENHTFEATESYVENRCTFKGNYHFDQNVLILDDANIESKTGNNFTKRYLVVSDSLLQPIDKKYNRILLE